MTKTYRIDDYGLLIGLISTPAGVDTDTFFNNEIEKNLSKLYKKNRFKTNEETKLYTFKGYKTFGDHDLAVISLIDDFSYPNRVFHPAHGNRQESSSYYNYEYQIMTCLNTLPESSKDIVSNVKLENFIWPSENKQSIDQYPYICITRAKLSNYFLLGNGIHFTELVKRYLMSRNNFYNKGRNNMKTIVLDNMGCEEIVILNFSYNLSSIAEFNHEIRCCNFSKLEEIDSEESEYILKNKFISNDSDAISWKEAHIFSSFYSLPGYSMQTNSTCLEKVETREEREIQINFVWDIKPGHAANFKKEFQTLLKELALDDQNIINKEPLRLNSSSWLYKLSLPVYEKTKKNIFEIVESIRNFDNHKNHVRKVHMKMEIYDTIDGEGTDTNLLEKHCQEIDTEQHPQTSLYSKKLQISATDLCELRASLEKANASKLLRERIMKMYNNYNNCITDPMFFGSFIDLHGSMKSFKDRIKNYAETSHTESSISFHEWMNTQVVSFEQAYYNRFHQSNRMREMSDFNLEWNGGIQQIISPLDSAFKEFLSHFGYIMNDKFVHVSGYERVQVTENTFRINMLHITYPELFASTIWKEIFNFYWRTAFSDGEQIYFTKNDFHEYLKYSIEHRSGFDRYNPVHQILLNSIDKDFTNAFVADTLSFYYGYAGEFDDFTYWYWKYLFQTPLYYDKSRIIDQKIFLKFLSRILFVGMLENEDKIESMFYHPADPVLAELWITNFKDVLSFVKLIKTVFEWHRYKLIIKNMAIKLMEKDLGKENESKSIPKEQLTKYISEIEKERKKQYIDGVLDYYICFSQGKIPFIGPKASTFKLVQLFGAFLKYLKNVDKKGYEGKTKTQILYRNNEGKPDLSQNKGNSSHILADPHGGMFCPEAYVQKECFKARSSFYRALFDLCMQNKKKQIDLIK